MNYNSPNSDPDPYNWVPGTWDPSQLTGLVCPTPTTDDFASWMPLVLSTGHTTSQVCFNQMGGYTLSKDIPSGLANPEDHQMIQATYIPSTSPVLFPTSGSSVTYTMDFQPYFWQLPVMSGSCLDGAPDSDNAAYSQMSLLFDYCPGGVIDIHTKISFQPANFSACMIFEPNEATYGQDGTTGNYFIKPKMPDIDPHDNPPIGILTPNMGTTALTTTLIAPHMAYVKQSYTVTYARFMLAIHNLNVYGSPKPNPLLSIKPEDWCWENAHINSETHFDPNGAGVQFGWSATNINITNTVP